MLWTRTLRTQRLRIGIRTEIDTFDVDAETATPMETPIKRLRLKAEPREIRGRNTHPARRDDSGLGSDRRESNELASESLQKRAKNSGQLDARPPDREG